MRRTRTSTVAAGLVAMALVSAACGGDDGDEDASATTAGGSAGSTTAASAAGTATTAEPQPTSLAGWEALWEKEQRRDRHAHQGQQVGQVGRREDADRARRLDGGPHQVPTRVVRHGRGQRHLDPHRCLPGPLSGTFADAGNLGTAIGFLFSYYNDQGFFEDAANGKVRKVDYTMKDDGYEPSRAIPNRRRAAGLGQGLRHLDARHSVHTQDLRQDQPALRASADGAHRRMPPGVTR